MMKRVIADELDSAIQTILAFLMPFPALVSRYLCIRFSVGVVNRKISDETNIYLA